MALTFLEQQLDTRITINAQCTVSMLGRTKLYPYGGRMRQNFTSGTLCHYADIAHGVRNRTQAQQVTDAFYAVMGGSYSGMRVRYAADYIGTRENTALLNVGGSNWQLQRKHVFGAAQHLRNVYKPVAGSIQIYNAGGSILTATVDPVTGIAAVTGTPATWTGMFDLPMTFTNDDWVNELLRVNFSDATVVLPSIKLEEIDL